MLSHKLCLIQLVLLCSAMSPIIVWFLAADSSWNQDNWEKVQSRLCHHRLDRCQRQQTCLCPAVIHSKRQRDSDWRHTCYQDHGESHTVTMCHHSDTVTMHHCHDVVTICQHILTIVMVTLCWQIVTHCHHDYTMTLGLHSITDCQCGDTMTLGLHSVTGCHCVDTITLGLYSVTDCHCSDAITAHQHILK